jgi:hypothetical protein
MPRWPATNVVMLGKLKPTSRVINDPTVTPRPTIDYLPPYTTPIAGQNVIRQIVMNGVRGGMGSLFGPEGAAAAAIPVDPATGACTTPTGARIAYGVLVAASGALSLFHGYRRNNGSLGWGLGWFALGSLFPVITPTVAFAQGFGKRKGR